MSDCVRIPKVHRVQRIPLVVSANDVDILDIVLDELCATVPEHTRRRYRQQCKAPESLTRNTVIALDRLGCVLKGRGVSYYRLRIEEIRRLIRAAPRKIKQGLKLDSLI